MEFDHTEWDVRYRAFRARADELHRRRRDGEIGDDDAALQALVSEDMALMAEIPAPPPVPPKQAAFEEAKSELTVAVLFRKPSRSDARELQIWAEENYKGSPRFEDEHLSKLAANLIYCRDRMGPAAVVSGEINVTLPPPRIDFQPTIVVHVDAPTQPQSAVESMEVAQSPKQVTNDGRPHLTAEERAIGILASNPDLRSVAAVAEKAGCSREHLQRNCARFMAAWRALKSVSPSRVIRGTKSKTGDVEAWEEEE